MRLALRLALLVALMLGAAVAAPAQSVEVDGRLDIPADSLLREILARGRFLLLDRDTVLPHSFLAAGDLVVVDADVRLEGRVEGAAAVVGGALFVRPGAHVGGPIAALGGQLLVSRLATTGPLLELSPRAQARLAREGAGYRVTLVPPPTPPRFRPGGLLGLGAPTYDRVDGLTVRWGAALALSEDSVPPRLLVEASYRTARGEPGGRVALEAPVGGRWWVYGSGARLTRTPDAWIRDELSNSIGALLLGLDERNYFESDVAEAGLVRRPRRALVAGEGAVAPRLVVQASRDRSLAGGRPWSLSGDSAWRPNPSVSDGTLVSLTAGAQAIWRGATSRFAGDAAVEWAPGTWGDHRFALLVAHGTWDMLALWGHSIRVYGRVQERLGNGTPPAQRWSFVGGPATLPTLETAALRGDHLAFFQTDYLVPLRFVTLPLVGAPALRLSHATGTAWITGQDPPRWPQALGAGLQFPFFHATLHLDPAAASPRPVLSLGATWPR